MKKIFLGFLAFFLSATMFAAPRTAEQAAQIAAEFTNSQPQFTHVRKSVRNASNLRLAHTVAKPASTEAALYIFNQPDNNGWVMISADDNARTILGYSTEGAFNASNIPSNLRFWLDYYAERIAVAQPTASKVKKATAATYDPVAPLLGGIKWGQDAPYNDQCPLDTYDNTRCASGCVATAAAQIMYFWKWPAQGKGSKKYTWTNEAGTSGTEDVTFSSFTYEWDKMIDNYSLGGYTSAQASAVALLMYHVGVSCEMEYGGDAVGGSGAFTKDMRNGLVNNFSYKSSASFVETGSTTVPSTLPATFAAELKTGRPILMGGSTKNNEGHEFVCDGVDKDGLFHINWGWDGMSNGFFALSALDPDQQGTGGASSGQGFSRYVDYVTKIQPDKTSESLTSLAVSPASINLKINEKQQVTPVFTPALATNRAMYWSSEDATIATVTCDGVVVGVAPGTTNIVATSYDGTKKGSCAVTVSNEEYTGQALVVDFAMAKYDSSNSLPWTLKVYDQTTEEPWINFYFKSGSTNKIAGTYDLTGTTYYWPDASNDNKVITSTSGTLSITLVGVKDGANGCNTYLIQASFEGDDLELYSVNAVLEVCAENKSGSAITLQDALPVNIKWVANGTDFESTVVNNNKVTLPATNPDDCSVDKIFVGWCADDSYEHATDAPTFVKNGDAITADASFYAVYATPEGGGSAATEVASVTFKQTSDGSKELTVDGDFYDIISAHNGISSFSGSKVYEGAKGAKLGSSKSVGSITMNISTASVSKVIVNASQYGTDVGKIKVTIGDTELDAQSPANGLEFTPSTPINTSKIIISTTEKRAYVASISVISGNSSYVDYTTVCGPPAPKYAITCEATTNGTLATNPAAEAAAGRTVSIIVTPDEHFQLEDIYVKDEDDNDVEIQSTGYTFSFIMPAKAVTVSGSFVQQPKYTVAFYSDGTEISSADYFKGEIAAKPADPSSGCTECTFAGWWTEELPADNTEEKAWITNFSVGGDQDYYAIFSSTKGGSGVSEIASVTFKTAAADQGTALSNTTDIREDLVDSEFGIVAYSGSKLYAGKEGAKIGAKAGSGSITLTLDDEVAVSKVIVNGSKYGSDTGKLRVKAGTTELGSKSPAKNLEYEASTPVETDKIIVETTSKRAYVSSITIIAGSLGTTYYSSIIDCTPPTAIDHIETNTQNAIKRIENGQLVIIMDGKKFNAFGQTIE